MDRNGNLETLEQRGLGNTKPTPNRCVPCKKWCFTWNNYEEDLLETLETLFKGFCKVWVYGKEVAPTTNTKHLQGYVEFFQKTRPTEKDVLFKKFHWEKTKAQHWETAYHYCIKDGDYKSNIDPPELPDTIDCIATEDLYNWQRDIIELINKKPDPRTINWYVDTVGGIGKSELVRYLCIHYNALVLSGKGSDMKYGIVSYIKNKKRNPKLLIIDLPRTYDNDMLSYSGIEEIKNGLFFSSKYESDMVIFNRPHILIFSNQEPKKDNLTMDRWLIKHL